MMNLPLANILINIVAVIWLLSAILLIFIILIQKGKGGGLGGAFGGAGGGGGLLGTKTGDFLTWVTIGLVFAFFFLAIILVKYGGVLSKPSGLDAPVTGAKAPAEIDDENKDTEVKTNEEGTPEKEVTDETGSNEDKQDSGNTDTDKDADDME